MNFSTYRKHGLILLFAFFLSILLRLPNLDRPLSKHHEFNTAVILNGIISWKDAGGAANFNYIPLMTFQGASNRLLDRGAYTDSVGNQMYLSLGPGWYVLPYLVLNTLHLPFTPLSIQILNLFIQLFTLFALYRLVRVITKKYSFLSPQLPLYTCLVFLFMPGPLWYFGNGYVHAAISLPFAILVFTQFLKFSFFQQKLKPADISIIVINGILGIYLDWFTFFLLGSISLFSLYFSIKEKNVRWFKMAALCTLTAFLGVAIIFIQFVSLLGYKKVTEYWVGRAGDRSFNNEDSSIIKNILSLCGNLVTCAGISICCAIIVIIFFKKIKKTFPLLPCFLWAFTCICYNGLFFNWSFVHEFSMVPFCVLLSIVTAIFIAQIIPAKKSWLAFSIFVVFSMVQYYSINRPGKISRVGTPYNAEKLLGEQIKKEIPADYRIFSNAGNWPIAEYYAHRSFVLNRSSGAFDAQKQCDSFGISKAVWLKIEDYQIKEEQILK